MAKYTIEDVEILRQKSGISYEEAVNLLEYHNGSLAAALMDLEKNGRLKKKNNASDSVSHKGLKGIFDYLYRLRVMVKKEQMTIINLSSLFVLLTLITAPHICVIGLLAVLALGYRISLERGSRAFAQDTFDDLVRNARSNVQNTVHSFTRQFSAQEEKPQAEETEPRTQPRTQSAPSGTRPVNVQFPDGGSVDVRDEGDGYHEADIQ